MAAGWRAAAWFPAIVLTVCLVGSAADARPRPQPPRPGSSVVNLDECSRQAVLIEHRLGLPTGILLAMTIVESGYQGRPHPYALHIGRQSHYPGSFDKATALLDDAVARSTQGITVGCMQLSYADHAAAFAEADGILQPAANIRHAGFLLRAAERVSHSWTVALQRFQGGSLRQRADYVCRVWNHLRVLAPASASDLDARHCQRDPHPTIDPALIRATHDMRRTLIEP